MLTTERELPAKPTRRGRRSSQPRTELGLLIQKHIDRLGITRAELAQRLHVSSSTVGRLLNGDTRVVQRMSAISICDALGLDEMDRREFMKLAGVASASTFAFATGATKQKALLRYKIDLDLAEDHLKILRQMVELGGDAGILLQSAQKWYQALMAEQSYTKDIRLASIQIRFGLLVGNTQELVFPWYERHRSIQTFDEIEEKIFSRFRLDTFQQEYALLYSYRAPLYREVYKYDESTKQFEYGMHWAKRADDPMLIAQMFDGIHNSAVIGKELQWKYQLESAYKDVTRMHTGYRESALAELRYLEAEGYKRLAFNHLQELPRQMRQVYAQKAIKSFVEEQTSVEQFADSYGMFASASIEQNALRHDLLAKVSQAQCLVLVDPEEAIRLLERIRSNITRYYPALLSKVERTLYFAQGQLRREKINPLLLFRPHSPVPHRP